MLRIFFFRCLLVCAGLMQASWGSAQNPTDTLPDSVDPELLNILNARVPKEYTLGGIKVTGTKRYDEQLLISISGLTVGEVLVIPGGDNLSKAITNLWNQHLFSNVQIFFSRLEGTQLFLEIQVQERPALSKYVFKGIRKSDEDELKGKTGLIPGRVVTENVKISAIQAIQKYFTEKGFQSAKVKVEEVPDPALPNSIILNFTVQRGNKVRIDEIQIFGNEQVSEARVKKQLKGTKEMTRMTLYPTPQKSVYGEHRSPSLPQYVREAGFLSFSKTKELLDPYFRFKLFSSAKFNAKKYDEDREKVIDYYNSLGYRDAGIVADTQYYNEKGNLKIDIKIDEGHQYYFGNISWKGNTKYPDSVLNFLLGIRKGEIYNLETLNKKLGKQLTQEGGDISGLYMDDGYLFFRVDPVEVAVYQDTIDFEIRIIEGHHQKHPHLRK